MTYRLATTARPPRQRRQTRLLRQAQWQLEQQAREIDALRRRLAEVEQPRLVLR